MKDWRDPSKQALFVSEVATISLLGRKEDIELMEKLLDEASVEDLQRELIKLADLIRNRHAMGLRKDCCNQCMRFQKCELKWLKTERSMRPTCCPRCQSFQKCLKEFKKEEHKRRRKTDPPAAY